MRIPVLPAITCFVFLPTSCREDEYIILSTPNQVTPGISGTSAKSFFLLNEGNMGNDKTTFDYFDYEIGIYHKDIYAERDPGITQELGDMGNDVQIYGNKLYVITNCPHFVEVVNVETAKHIMQVSIPSYRHIVFKDKYAYASSYTGPIKIDPNARLGCVARVDATTLTVKDTHAVGCQPEEMVIAGNKLYVVSFGGYRIPNYDRTISAIGLNTFEVIKATGVGINLYRMELDQYRNIYVSSRGDYYDTYSEALVIGSNIGKVTDELPFPPGTEVAACRDSLYVYSTEWSHYTNDWIASYATCNIKTEKIDTHNSITDGTEKSTKIPYGIATNSETSEFPITDVKDYATPGTLYCFSRDERKKWSIITGGIPTHTAFTDKKLKVIRWLISLLLIRNKSNEENSIFTAHYRYGM